MTFDIVLRSYSPIPDPPAAFKLGRPFPFTVEDGTTIGQLVSEVLSIPPGEVALAAVNGERASKDYVLRSEDQLDLFPPIGGGCATI